MTDQTYPPTPTSDEVQHLVSVIKDWSIAHGLAVRPPPALVAETNDPHGILATTAPVTLFPSPFPSACFEQAWAVQKDYNELYAAIAQDEAFLKGIVEEYVVPRTLSVLLREIKLKDQRHGHSDDV